MTWFSSGWAQLWVLYDRIRGATDRTHYDLARGASIYRKRRRRLPTT